MTPEAARRDALIKLGGIESTKERYRDRRGLRGLETLVQDVRFGARTLRKNSGFTAVVVITLALGIGANTAIFSLLDSVVLRFLPVEKPEQLVQITRRGPEPGHQGVPSFTNPIWEQVRDQQDMFSGALAFGAQEFDLAQGGEAHYAKGLWVSGDFFRTLGVRAAAGRLITVGDDQRGCSGVAVLSYSFWQDHFGGAPSTLGSRISLDNHTYPVIGVAAPGFYGVEVGAKFDVALPFCATAIFDGARPRLDHRSWWWLDIVGRLKPGNQPRSVASPPRVDIAPRLRGHRPRQLGRRQPEKLPKMDAHLRARLHRHFRPAPAVRAAASNPYGSGRNRAADSLRQYRRPHAGSRRN